MSQTAMAWVGGFFVLLFMGILHPVFPFLAYLQDYYQHPPLRWWGRALPDLRWSLTPAVVWLGACLLHGALPNKALSWRHKQTQFLVAYVGLAFLVTQWAVVPDRSLAYAQDLLRLLVLYLLITTTIRTRRHFHWVVIAMLLGGFTWGWRAWTDPKREAGRLQNIGGPDSRNDNSAAAALLPLLPFAAIFMFTGSKLERVVAFGSAPFIVNTVILCNSRGATVAVAAAGLAAVALTKGRVRRRTVALIAVGALAGLALSDPEFIERQMTIVSGERDGAARGRIEAWKGSFDMMRDYPLGAGGGGFDSLSPRYIPQVTDRFGGAERGVHNTYLNIGPDWGITGLILFLGYLGSTFMQLQRVRTSTADSGLAYDALALQVGLVAFAAAAFFINRTYAELFFWLPALGAALANIHAAETAELDGGAVLPLPQGDSPTDLSRNVA